MADAPVDSDAADRFNYGDIADGLARLIDEEQTATPLTIALSAPWGAGKTSLVRLVEDRVVRQKAARDEAPTIVVWFNAWMHDAAPNLSAALAADVARKATSCRDPWMRLWHPLPSSMLSPKERARRRFWLGVAALVSAVAFYPLLSSFIGPSHADVTKVRAAFGASIAGWLVFFWGVSLLWPRVQRSLASVAAFVDDPRSAAATGSMSEVSAQMGELIREAQDGVRRAWRADQPPRFVVIVDDLERCQPPKAVDMCEVAAQLLDHPGVITVLVGDLKVIAASAELKYRDAVDTFSKDADFAAEGFGRFFLQKVVQFELELPPIAEERLRQLARSAPATASIYGSGGNRSIPKPKLMERLYGSSAVGWFLPMAGSVLGVAALFIQFQTQAKSGRNSALPVWFWVVLGAFITLFFVSSVYNVWANYRRKRIRRLRIEVSRLVDNVISSELSNPGLAIDRAELEAQVVNEVAEQTANYEKRRFWRHVQPLTSADEVRRRMQLRATADEETRSSAEKVILELLPPLPRTAKRLLNRLYFLLVVAYNRNLISRHRVSAEQLGKWAVLLDRWPAAGKAIIKNPGLVQVLEHAAEAEDEFATLCSAPIPPLAVDPAPLRNFFQTDPKLAAAAYYLVYLDADVHPAQPPAIGPSAGAEQAMGVTPADAAAVAHKQVARPDAQHPTTASITP